MSLFGLGRNQRTFRPKKSAPSGSKGAQLRKHIDATLGSGNLREAVRLPPGEDINEWLAVNTVDFFNQVNLLYGTLTEFCTPENCPTMTAGPNLAKLSSKWSLTYLSSDLDAKKLETFKSFHQLAGVPGALVISSIVPVRVSFCLLV
ncbi:hypothetical protein KY290_035366 [Solanum tuberosum]|uniref:MOB kinase activator-like 1A n=1 Tax=Solanum tuberosum TaxID=4113 RepID=A0ABQ7U7P6_SOLTU|nr:hypothetical protein KY290_035366 [Solanum tuberosum]